MAPRRHFKTQAENGAYRALLTTTRVVALAAVLLLTAIAATLLAAAVSLHAGHRHARRQPANEILHVRLLAAGKPLLSAVAPLKHLCGIIEAHLAKTTALLSSRRSDEGALTPSPSESAADGTVAEDPGAAAAAAAPPTGGHAATTRGGAKAAAATKSTALSKSAALPAEAAGLAAAGLAKPAAARLTASALRPQVSAGVRRGSQKHAREN